MIEGGPEELCRDIDDRHDPVVGHARRPDHAEDADVVFVGCVWRGDDADIVEDFIARFLILAHGIEKFLRRMVLGDAGVIPQNIPVKPT